MSGTITSPSLTGSVPPGTKQFWTSMTRSTSVADGLSGFPAAWANAALGRPASPATTMPAATVVRNSRRSSSRRSGVFMGRIPPSRPSGGQRAGRPAPPARAGADGGAASWAGAGEPEPLRDDVDRDHPRAHGRAQHRRGEAHGPLAEDRERVAPGDVEALERAVGGAGPARDRGALLEAEGVGQGHERPRRHLHVGRVPAVARHAIHDDAVRTELRPADAAVLAAPAALVVMVHHARPRRRLVLRDAGPARGDDAARLVAGDDGPGARAEAERGGGVADGAVGVEIAPAHAGGLDGDDDLARARGRVGELAELELPVAEEDDALHLSILCVCR